MADKQSREGKLYKCLKCGWQDVISPSNPRKDGRVCSKCGGYSNLRGFVGRDFAPGRDLTVKMDFTESIKGLKAVQREARKATAALKELEERQNKYLVIEIDELGNVPRVLFKGKEISGKEFINFQWMTKTDKPGSTDIIVDYYEMDDIGIPVSKSISESRLK